MEAYAVDRKEAERVAAFVRRSSASWTRVASSPLRTLGFPAYRFDGDRTAYFACVVESNRVLRASVGKTIRRVLDAIGALLNEDIQLLYDVAHPGFHILAFDECPSYDPGPPHSDAPYLRVPWLNPQAVDPGDNLSFVVPVELPEAPCGLEIFPLWRTSRNAEGEEWTELEPTLYSYRIGYLYLFPGSWRHRLSPVKGSEGELRITLQGHLARLNGRLFAYW